MKKNKNNIINVWLKKNGKPLPENSFNDTCGCVADVDGDWFFGNDDEIVG